MAQLVAQYYDLPLGTTDASVIALAERLGIDEVATLDQRHFRTGRPVIRQLSSSCRSRSESCPTSAPHLPHELRWVAQERYRTPSGSHVHQCPKVG